MATGYKAFRKAQFEIEGTPGTKPTITNLLVGNLGFNPEVTWFEPDEDTGLLSRFTRRTKVGERTNLSFDGAATYEQIIYFLACGLLGSNTPSAAGSAYIWTFQPSLTSANTPDTMSIEAGDSAQEWDIPYVFVTNLEFTIAMNAALMLRADMIGRPMAKGSFTGSIDLPTVEDILCSKGKLCIDDSLANYGVTPKSTLLVGGTIRMPTGLVPIDYADGELYYGGYAEGKRAVEMDLTFVMSTDAITEYDAFQASTLRFIELSFDGSTLNGRDKNLKFHLCGKYESWEKIGEHEGLDVVSVHFKTEFDPTSEKEFTVFVTNGVDAY